MIAKGKISTFTSSFNSFSSADVHKIVASFIIGMAIGGLVVWSIMGLRTQPLATSKSSSVSVKATPTPTTSLFTVEPQSAGNKVVINNLSLSEPLWVVVYDNNNGSPGSALGAAVALPENHSIVVPLLRLTKTGGTYLVGLTKIATTTHGYSRLLPTLNVWQTFTAQ